MTGLEKEAIEVLAFLPKKGWKVSLSCSPEHEIWKTWEALLLWETPQVLKSYKHQASSWEEALLGAWGLARENGV